jgi:hypothetical protein
MDDEKRVNEPAAAYATITYDDVLSRAQRLNPADQQRLLKELVVLARRRVMTQTQSILKLQGLGKEIWRDIDAQAFIDQERDSWNG